MHLGGGDPRPERVEGRRREAGDAREPVGGHGAPRLPVRLEGVGHLVQPHDRAGLADRQVDEVRRHLGAERGRLELVVDDRHRDDRLELAHARHRLRARQQPAAQGSGDRGEHDVVDRAAVRLPDPAVDGEVGAHRDEPALLRERTGDRGVADGPAVGQGRADLGEPPEPAAGRAQRELGVRLHGAENGRGVRQRLLQRIRDQGRGATVAAAAATRPGRGSSAQARRRAAPGRGRRSRHRRPGSGGTSTAGRTGRPRAPRSR